MNSLRFMLQSFFKDNVKIWKTNIFLKIVRYLYAMKQILLVLVAFALLSFGCKKYSDNIPRVPVNEYINLSLPTYNNLNITGNWIYYPAGNKGLIIFRTSTTEFAAYDRTCSYDPMVTKAIIYGVVNNVYGVDSVCGSHFSFYDGGVLKGPATHSLLKYQTYFDGVTLHVFN